MLKEGVDFYFNESGYMVFSRQYHLNRGYCCKNGCLNCPWKTMRKEEKTKTEIFFLDVTENGSGTGD